MLEPHHPRPRFRHQAQQARCQAEQQERQGQAQPQRQHHRHGDRRRLAQPKADRRAHEGRRTRRRDDNREHAGEEGAGKAGSPGQAAADPDEAPADFEQTGEIQPDQDHQPGHEQDEDRLLKLEAPAGHRACAAHGQQHRADDGEARQNAEGIGRAVPAHAPALVSVAGETQRLDGEHRQHAGHQVKDQAAQQGKNHRLPEADKRRRVRFGRGKTKGLGRHLTVDQLFLDDEQSADTRDRFGRPAALRLQRQAAVRYRQILRRRIFHHAVAPRIEPGVFYDFAFQSRRRNIEPELLAIKGILCGPGRRFRPRRPGFCEYRPRSEIGDRRIAGDRKVELQDSLFRDTDRFADQPGGVRRQVCIRAGPGVLRHRDRHQMDRLVAVTVVDQRPDREALRRQPDDFAGGIALGQHPVDPRRLTRIAGVAPVGVPLGNDPEIERNPGGRAGPQRHMFAQQFRRHMLRLEDPAGRSGLLSPALRRKAGQIEAAQRARFRCLRRSLAGKRQPGQHRQEGHPANEISNHSSALPGSVGGIGGGCPNMGGRPPGGKAAEFRSPSLSRHCASCAAAAGYWQSGRALV